MEILYKYKNAGAWIVGIPAKDLSKDDFEALSDVDKETVRTCGLYELVKPTKSVNRAQEKQ